MTVFPIKKLSNYGSNMPIHKSNNLTRSNRGCPILSTVRYSTYKLYGITHQARVNGKIFPIFFVAKFRRNMAKNCRNLA